MTLNGSGSSDPDGDALTFLWRFLSVPPPSTVTEASLANGNSAAPHFTPDVDGAYELALEASDGAMSAVDTVIVTARAANVPPNANAGPDASGVVGQLVNLDGRGSADPDNGPASLRFRWSFAAVPPGSFLSDIDIADARFGCKSVFRSSSTKPGVRRLVWGSHWRNCCAAHCGPSSRSMNPSPGCNLRE